MPLIIPVFSLELGQEDIGATSPDTTERQAYDLITAGFGVGYNGPLQVASTLDPVATPERDVHQEVQQGAGRCRSDLEQKQKELPKQQKQLEKQQQQLEDAAGSRWSEQGAELEGASRRASSAQADQLRAQQAALEQQAAQLQQERQVLEAQRLPSWSASGGAARGRPRRWPPGSARSRASWPGSRSRERALAARDRARQGPTAPPGAAARATRRGAGPRGGGPSSSSRPSSGRRGTWPRRPARSGTRSAQLRSQAAALAAQADELERQKAALEQQGAELQAAGRSQLQAQGGELQEQADELQAQGDALQQQADELKAEQKQAQQEQKQAEKLQTAARRDMVTQAGGDPRGTDPRVVNLQDALSATAGVVALTPPQINKHGDVVMLSAVPSTSPRPSTRPPTWSRPVRDACSPASTPTAASTSYVGGFTASYVDLAALITDRLLLVIGTVILLGFLLLMVAFRSLLIPLQAAITNLLSAAAAFGVLTAAFQWGWGISLLGIDTPDSSVPIASYVPLMMFAGLFGLSMDYEVFLVSHIQQHHHARRGGTAGVGVRARARAPGSRPRPR